MIINSRGGERSADYSENSDRSANRPPPKSQPSTPISPIQTGFMWPPRAQLTYCLTYSHPRLLMLQHRCIFGIDSCRIPAVEGERAVPFVGRLLGAISASGRVLAEAAESERRSAHGSVAGKLGLGSRGSICRGFDIESDGSVLIGFRRGEYSGSGNRSVGRRRRYR